ncbi:MAG: sigma 54-interacting transcriptional regulator [Acidobacteria bacterium]|jgi:DNA-binding NtrC family response regulator/pSer/pThr/pTyr-binding forkhead associated (FHA) protein|nr:sigma 54-interacting transcriptional regulator [Acidobacteriota bacterium]
MYFLEARVGGRSVRWPLRDASYVVGRESGCEVIVPDPRLSRRHFRLTIAGRIFSVEDLGSTSGVICDEQRIERQQVELDQWFAAGATLFAVREGVTFTSVDEVRPVGSLEGPPSAREGNAVSKLTQPPPHGVAADGSNRVSDRADLSAWLAELAGAVANARDAEDRIRWALHFAARHSGAETVAIVQRGGNGWSVAGLHGDLRAPAVDAALELLSGTAAFFVQHDGQFLLGCPVHSGAADGDGWMLLYPWRGPRAPTPEILLTASLCGSWLDLRGDGSNRSGSTSASPEAAGGGSTTQPAGNGSKLHAPTFLGNSAAVTALLAEVDRLAIAALPILLQGESGTGKELLARRLHVLSPRRSGPFVALNCAALPAELLEAELFGIERGVATGVSARIGRLAQASGGTLFLDEVGDLPPALQPKLLRAIESGEVTPLGAPAALRIDVRLVSATNQDLEDGVRQGRFRSDLMYRLAGAVIRLPALRERPEDILPLARAFAREAAGAQGRPFRGIDLDATRILLGCEWPGNVRQLRHAMHRAVALADGAILHAGLLPADLAPASDALRGAALLDARGEFREARVAFERFYFAKLLERAAGNLSEAARLAGVSRSFLYEKLEELGLR